MSNFFEILKDVIQLKSRSAVIKERGKDLLRRDVGSYIDGFDNDNDDQQTLSIMSNDDVEKPSIDTRKSTISPPPVPLPSREPPFLPEPGTVSPTLPLPTTDSPMEDRRAKEDWKPMYRVNTTLSSATAEDDTDQKKQYYMPLTHKTRAHQDPYMQVEPHRRTSSEQRNADYLDMSGGVVSPTSDHNFSYDAAPTSYPSQPNYPYSHNSS